jgi:hypothetical protein
MRHDENRRDLRIAKVKNSGYGREPSDLGIGASVNKKLMRAGVIEWR